MINAEQDLAVHDRVFEAVIITVSTCVSVSAASLDDFYVPAFCIVVLRNYWFIVRVALLCACRQVYSCFDSFYFSLFSRVFPLSWRKYGGKSPSGAVIDTICRLQAVGDTVTMRYKAGHGYLQ